MTVKVKCLRSIGSGLVLLGIALPIALFGFQSQSGNSEGESRKTLSSDHIADLLRKPNGLEACANLVGRFEFSRNIRPWTDIDLKTEVAASTLIVIGTVQSAVSRLVDDGDDIETLYTVRPTKLLKGSATGDVSFTAQGGSITFASGNTATIHSVEYELLQTGQRYLIFLQKEQDGRYSLTNGLESLFKLSTPDGKVDALASHDGRQHAVVPDVKGLSASELVAKASALSAAAVSPNH